MGLDSVELVLEVEDEFKISLSDQEASRVTTVGELVDLVYARLRHSMAEPCPSQHGFYVIRRILMDRLHVQRTDIRPDTPLADLIGVPGRRRIWREVIQAVTGQEDMWLKLVRPIWLKILMFTLTACVFFVDCLRAGPEIAIFSSLVALAVLGAITVPFKMAFPREYSRAKDLIRFVKTLDAKAWSREEVFAKIKTIVSEQLGVKESDVTMDAHFVKDLGLS